MGHEGYVTDEREHKLRIGSLVSSARLAELVEEANASAAGAIVSDGAEIDAVVELPEGRFADRELSWLAFNERVLEQAEDESLPILERAWFLAIFASNLDEFFMVRVAGLKRRIATGMAVTKASGMPPRQVLDAISERTAELMARHARVFRDDIQPKLADVGIVIRHWHELSETETHRLKKF